MARERTRSRQHTPSLEELALLRWIGTRETALDVRLYGWRELQHWENAQRCRYAMEAIVSCALTPDSKLYGEAKAWVIDQQANPLLHAVVLQEASVSSATRSTVLKELFDPCKLYQYPGFLGLWGNLEGQYPNWNVCVQAARLERWDDFPPDDCLHAACRWVMENPSPEQATVRAQWLIERSEQLGTRPWLRRQIVGVSLRDEQLRLLPCLQEHFPLFWQEIVGALKQAGDPTPGHETVTFYDGLFVLADTVLNGLSMLDEVSRQQAVSQLVLAKDAPWVWAIAPELPYREQDYDAAVELYEHWLCHYRSPWHRSKDRGPQARAALERLNERQPTLVTVIANFPDVLQIRLFGEIVGQNHRWGTECAPFLEAIKEKPEAFEPTICSLSEKGKIDSTLLLEIVQAMGAERAKEVVETWLGPSTAHLDSDHHSYLVQYVLKYGIAAGRLLYDDGLASRLFLNGYTFRPADLATETGVRNLLPTKTEHNETQFVPTALWRDEKWRDPVLTCGKAGKWVLFSALLSAKTCAPARTDPREWVETTIVPLCDQHDHLKRALVQLAGGPYNPHLRCDWWSSTPAELARQILKSEERRDWVGEKEWAGIRSSARDHLEELVRDERDVAVTIFTLAELRDSFFRQAVKDRISLGDPEGWLEIFPSETDRAKLRQWLLVHEPRIDVTDWIAWVRCFGFTPDPAVRGRIFRRLDTLYHGYTAKVLSVLE